MNLNLKKKKKKKHSADSLETAVNRRLCHGLGLDFRQWFILVFVDVLNSDSSVVTVGPTNTIGRDNKKKKKKSR